MDELTRFIDYHYKSIVSTIRARHVLTLHLSTANWRKLTTGSCCKNAPSHYVIFYQIESYHSSLSCSPVSMQINGTLILLYFIEILPRTVSITFYVTDILGGKFCVLIFSHFLLNLNGHLGTTNQAVNVFRNNNLCNVCSLYSMNETK